MVARSLGLTDPAVHYHFPSKHALYLAVLTQPDYGPLPLDQAVPSRETVIEQVLHLVNWWIAHPKLGQMILRGQLANEDPALQYLAASEASWDRLVTEPLTQVAGEAASDLSNLISDLLWGIYSDAVFAYGENTWEVAGQEYYQRRLRAMVELALPESL